MVDEARIGQVDQYSMAAVFELKQRLAEVTAELSACQSELERKKFQIEQLKKEGTIQCDEHGTFLLGTCPVCYGSET